MEQLNCEVLADGFWFLEGPRWRDGKLWLADMWDETVWKIGVDGSRERVISVPGRPSGLGFLPDGTPLVVSMADRRLYQIVDGELIEHADLSALVSGDLNDMVVDASGRAWVGNFGYDLFSGAEAAPAEIVVVEANGAARVVARDLNFPNGTVIKDEGGALVVAESWGGQLTAFDLAADGSLNNRRLYAALGERVPDGICLDQAGGIWVASFATAEFIRVLDGGEITHRVDARGKAAVACQLGGDDGRTLFCLTYDGELNDITAGKRAAAIEVCRVQAAAAGSP